MAVPPLLRDLLTAVGPSGREGPAAAVWREAAAPFAEVTSDTLGTSFARLHAGRGGEGPPLLAIVGHIDEIGLAVTNIDDDGLLSFTTIGGISPETLHGQRFELMTRNGRIPAAVTRKRLYPEQLRDRPRLELADLHLDIGATSREDAEQLVRRPRDPTDNATPSGLAALVGALVSRIVCRCLIPFVEQLMKFTNSQERQL